MMELNGNFDMIVMIRPKFGELLLSCGSYELTKQVAVPDTPSQNVYSKYHTLPRGATKIPRPYLLTFPNSNLWLHSILQ